MAMINLLDMLRILTDKDSSDPDALTFEFDVGEGDGAITCHITIKNAKPTPRDSTRASEAPIPAKTDDASMLAEAGKEPTFDAMAAKVLGVSSNILRNVGATDVVDSNVKPSSELDSRGVPWNGDVHGKVRNSNGVWRKKRGVPDDVKAVYENQWLKKPQYTSTLPPDLESIDFYKSRIIDIITYAGIAESDVVALMGQISPLNNTFSCLKHLNDFEERELRGCIKTWYEDRTEGLPHG